MVKVRSFSGPPKPKQSRRKAVGPSEAGGQANREEIDSSVARPVVSAQQSAPPIVPEPATAPAVILPPGQDLVVVEEEEGGVDRPLKRRKKDQVVSRPPHPSDRCKGKEKVGDRAAPSAPDKGKRVAGSTNKWEPAISFEMTASISDPEVARQLAEKVIPPSDEERYAALDGEELMRRAIRNSLRDVAFTLFTQQRVEQLDREVQSLLEQVDGLKTELSEAREERDLARGQLSSLEEERKLWEEDRNILRAQLASGEEERNSLKARLTGEEVERVRAMAERNKLAEDYAMMRAQCESERVLKEKYLADCRAAVGGQSRAEDELKRVRASIKGHRIEAILRWQKRFLQEECLEYSCDLALMILQNCYNAHVPAGSDGPSFEGFAEPLLPAAFGLSLEEVKKRAQDDRSVPIEELDLSSAEEDESFAPAPSDPAPEASPRQSQSGDF